MNHAQYQDEGGHPEREVNASAPPPKVVVNPESLYYSGKRSLDAWLGALKRLDKGLANRTEAELANSQELSTRSIASIFREISRIIWAQNDFIRTGGFSLLGFGGNKPIPIQKDFNDRLWTHNPDGSLDHVTSDDLAPLFVPGKQAEWPNLVLTSNHARAWQSSNLSDLMAGIEQLANDSWSDKLDLLRIKNHERPKHVGGKTIVALACHTERDMYLNGAKLLDRRLNLEEDPNKENPRERTIEGISPAAIRLAKLMLKLMVEPPAKPTQGYKLVDLDRAVVHPNAPFVADDHTASLVIRADAASIAQHIKLVGYSRGANTVTDALRFLYREYAALGDRLQVRDKSGKLHAATDKDMSALIGNIGLLSLAPGEVPLTKAEKYTVGINRVTILNTHDLTAGHLVNPDRADYDRWSDRLIEIEGTLDESGHSIVAALGKDGKPGFIMDPANTNRPNYRTAQDEVRAFFASNHQRHAITTLCLSHEGPENMLYVQFAPGITRADARVVEAQMEKSLHAHGFANAEVKSDLSGRRLMRVVLDHDAGKRPVIANSPTGEVIAADRAKIARCQQAFASLGQASNAPMFVTQDVVAYLEELQQAAQTLPRNPASHRKLEPARVHKPAARRA